MKTTLQHYTYGVLFFFLFTGHIQAAGLQHIQPTENITQMGGSWTITTRAADGTQIHRKIHINPDGTWQDESGEIGQWHKTNGHITLTRESFDESGRHSQEIISMSIVDEERSVSVGTWTMTSIASSGNNGAPLTESHTYHVLFEPENIWSCFSQMRSTGGHQFPEHDLAAPKPPTMFQE